MSPDLDTHQRRHAFGQFSDNYAGDTPMVRREPCRRYSPMGRVCERGCDKCHNAPIGLVPIFSERLTKRASLNRAKPISPRL